MFFTLQAFQHVSLARKAQFLKTCPKKYPISQQVHPPPAARKIVRNKKKSRAKVQSRYSRTVFKKVNMEATKMSLSVADRIIAHKSKFPLRH